MLDYDGNVPSLDDLELGLFEDLRLPIVALITTPSLPFGSGFESIATLTILDLKTKVAWELLKIQLTLQQ
jgi:hypothetical protein